MYCQVSQVRQVDKSKFLIVALGDDGHLKPGLIEYLIDGVLPLLHIFYSSHFDPMSIPNEEQKKMEYNVSAQIAKNLIVSFFRVDTSISF